jgi:hypothetical protein
MDPDPGGPKTHGSGSPTLLSTLTKRQIQYRYITVPYPFTAQISTNDRGSSSVSSFMDQHRFDADPDPDPIFHFDADPDQDPSLKFYTRWKLRNNF